MAKDHAPSFVANPVGFMAANAIGLHQIGSKTTNPAWQNNNDATYDFTLSQETKMLGLMYADDIPMLRIHPAGVATTLTTFRAKWCNASARNTAVDAIPYCDIPLAPAAADPRFVFTVAMNGCSYILASAVSAAAPPLAVNHIRLLHDRTHYDLQHWANNGYTIRAAFYASGGEAGGVPAAWGAAPVVATYNPQNYGWGSIDGSTTYTRVVSNFLYWDGTDWLFCSRHYHEVKDLNTKGGKDTLSGVDVPPTLAAGPRQPSTQALVI